jgi:FkbM family methyltransferase
LTHFCCIAFSQATCQIKVEITNSSTLDQRTSPVTRPDHAASVFLTHLISELLSNCQRLEIDNTDRVRFGYSSSIKTAVKDKILDLAASLGFYRASAIRYDLLRNILKVDGLDHAYGLFQDQLSRDLFVKLLAYRVLGYRHVRLPLNNAKYWELRQSVDKYVEKRDAITRIPILGSLDLCNVNGIHLYTHPLSILNIFLLEQYRCARSSIGVNLGDVAIDAGACWGDTTLYFAQNAAQVFCFECIPSNITIIQQNLGLNPSLCARISVIQKALWSRSRQKFVFKDCGPGSRPASDGLGVDVETQTLDDFVSANSLERVDFIKMDTEGSELEVLIGAERTVRKHRPQLAISIYHDLSHFASIPNWIDSLGLGYRLYLDHFTIHEEETVLFARSDP